MIDEDVEAELFNPVVSGIFSVDWLHDAGTGIWRSPLPSAQVRGALRSDYLRQTGARDPTAFDEAFPYLWRLPGEPRSSDRPTLAILDTGCLTAHPLLDGCIEDVRDFTGEGIEDRIGHGTGCALIARMLPHGGWRPRLLIGKVFAQDRRHAARNMIQALEWAVGLASAGAVHVVVRLGFYHRRLLGLRSCDGGCTVCRAAIRALNNPHVAIDAAPGNRPGQTACPAVAALRLRRAGAASSDAGKAARFVSVAQRGYPDAGVGTDLIEGDGRYFFSDGTVTLYPPRLLLSLMPDAATAAAMDARRRSSGEPFFVQRGSWQIASIGARADKVPLWPGGQEGGLSFGYRRDAEGWVGFHVPELPGFSLRAPQTDLLHIGLPAALEVYLRDHPEIPGHVRDKARETARKLAPD